MNSTLFCLHLLRGIHSITWCQKKMFSENLVNISEWIWQVFRRSNWTGKAQTSPKLGRHSSNTCSWFSMGHWMTMITQWSANIFCYGLRRFRHTACTLCQGSQNFFILRNSKLMSSPNWTLFNNILQNNDTTEQFVTSLQLHVIDCNYRDSNEMVRDLILVLKQTFFLKRFTINSDHLASFVFPGANCALIVLLKETILLVIAYQKLKVVRFI